MKGFFIAFILSSPVSILLHNYGKQGLAITVPVEIQHKPAARNFPGEVKPPAAEAEKTPHANMPQQPETIVNHTITSQKTPAEQAVKPNTQKTAAPSGTLKSVLPENNGNAVSEPSVTLAVKPSRNIQSILYILLTAIWVAASLMLLLRFFVDNIYLMYIRFTAVQAKRSFADTCKSVAAKLGVRIPNVLQSPYVKSPFAAGIFRPYIFMPMGKFERDLPEEEVFLHELAHLKRHDPFWNQLLRFVTALIPFQPLLWIYALRITETSDYVCDDFVMNHVDNHHTYARNLAHLARNYHPRGREIAAGAGLISIRSSLGRRIARIVDATHKFSLRVSARLVFNVSFLCAFTTFVSGLIGIKGKSAVQESYASETKPEKDKGETGVKSYTTRL
nr:M56 family metallopeptidase [uncultured Sulfurimonas sp.]